jgi:hypothetical protein
MPTPIQDRSATQTMQPAVYVVARLLGRLRYLSGDRGARLLVAVHADPDDTSRVYRLIVAHGGNVVYFHFGMRCRHSCRAGCATCPFDDIEPPPMWSYRTRMSRDELTSTLHRWDLAPVTSWDNVEPEPDESMRQYVDRAARWLFSSLLH